MNRLLETPRFLARGRFLSVYARCSTWIIDRNAIATSPAHLDHDKFVLSTLESFYGTWWFLSVSREPSDTLRTYDGIKNVALEYFLSSFLAKPRRGFKCLINKIFRIR